MPDPSEETSTVVVVRLQGRTFGIPCDHARAIHPLGAVAPVPGAPAGVGGLTDVEGRLSTVIDLARRLRLRGGGAGRVAVTVEFDGDLYTLPVDEVGDVVALPRRRAEAAPSGEEAPWSACAREVYRLGGRRLLTVLDLESVLDLEAAAD